MPPAKKCAARQSKAGVATVERLEELYQVIWWRNEKARPKNFNAESHNHARSQVLFSNLTWRNTAEELGFITDDVVWGYNLCDV